MMTYLPFPDFLQSISILDTDTLEEQANDIATILETLHETEPQYAQYETDPAVVMWRGYEPQLCELGLASCEELSERGVIKSDIVDRLNWHLDCASSGDFTLEKPRWFGDVDLHISHQAELVRKNYERYKPLFKSATPDIELIWPTNAE